MIGLPTGWVQAPLSELASRITKGTTPTTYGFSYTPDGIRFVKAESLDGLSVVHSLCAYVGADAHDAFRRSQLAPDDVLFTIAGTLGRVAIVSAEDVPANTNQAVAIIRLKIPAMARFVAHYLSGTDSVAEGGRGTGLQNLNLQQVSEIQVPLPALPEQQRIVAKLDRLVMHSKTVRQELVRISKLVDRQKLAILTAAIHGRATANWRAANPTVRSSSLAGQPSAKTSKRQGGNTVIGSFQRSHLPETWKVTTIDAIGEVILGRQRSPENHKGPHMRPYVRAANITWDGWDLSDVKQMNFDSRDFEKFKLKRGDVLINEGSGSADEVGKPAIWNGEIENCCFQNTLIAVRPRAVTSDYLYFVLLNAALSRAFVDETRGVNIHHIGRTGLAQFFIPVPPIEEQQQIVRWTKAAFAKLEKLIIETEHAGLLLDRLDQATLVKAFRGGLVPQNPNDKPASELLTRISEASVDALKADRTTGAKTDTLPRAPREKAAMTKSRHDDDVRDKPYLANFLKKMGRPTSVEELFKRAELPVTDFYKQLAWEVDAGHIRDDDKRLEAA